MKNLLLITLMLISTFGFAQDDYVTYTMDLLAEEKAEYNIELSEKNDKMIFWIEPAPLDRIYDEVSLQIGEEDIPEFIKVLRMYEQKYIEWKTIALENDIKEIKREMEIEHKIDRVFFNTGSSDWHSTANVKLVAYLMDFGDNLSLVIKNKNKLQSRTNQFTDCDGFYFIFEDTEEINQFISKFDTVKARGFITTKNKKASLFN